MCPILTQSLYKKNKKTMSHSRPCHPMLFTVPPVLQTKASSLSAGTELSAAATAISLLYWRARTSQQHWFTGEYRHYFLPLSLLFLPSLSALSVPPVRVTFLSWVCLTLPWQQRQSEAASTLSFSLILFFFIFFFHSQPSVELQWLIEWHHGSTGS